MIAMSYDQYKSEHVRMSVEIGKTATVIKNQVKYKIILNSKITQYFFLLSNLKIKKRASVLVFGIIFYGKIKSLMNGRPCRDSNQKCHRQ